jgi:hypothetical protein
VPALTVTIAGQEVALEPLENTENTVWRGTLEEWTGPAEGTYPLTIAGKDATGSPLLPFTRPDVALPRGAPAFSMPLHHLPAPGGISDSAITPGKTV